MFRDSLTRKKKKKCVLSDFSLICICLHPNNHRLCKCVLNCRMKAELQKRAVCFKLKNVPFFKKQTMFIVSLYIHIFVFNKFYIKLNNCINTCITFKAVFSEKLLKILFPLLILTKCLGVCKPLMSSFPIHWIGFNWKKFIELTREIKNIHHEK